MSVSSLLKNYRKRNGITQDELAERFGVAKMTISRIESGRQVTLSPKMVSLIAGIVDENDMATLDPSDPQERKLLDYIKYGTEASVSRTIQSKKAWSADDIKRQLDVLTGEIGYTCIKEKTDDLAHYVWKYRNEKNKKTWTIQIFPFDYSKKVNDIYGIFATRIGMALLFGEHSIENRITIVIPNSYDEIRTQLEVHLPLYIPFDLSILHLGNDGIIQQETCLRCNYDGRGIFDLDVEDNAVSAQAGKDYAAWTRAVGNIVMWEKSK